MRKRIDLSGETFGRLTVIEKADKTYKYGGTAWRCKCECGNDIVVSYKNLVSGHTKSCGCYNRELCSKRRAKAKPGMRFGRLTIIKKSGYDKFGSIMWECKCECGKTAIVRSNILLSGRTVSCGCYSREATSERSKKYNEYSICGDTVTMIASNGKSFMIDKCDLETVKDYCWTFDNNGYVISGRKVRIHRLIMNPPKGMTVDHINGDRSDNRRCNLRVCTQAQNSHNKHSSPLNKSGKIGVYLNKKSLKWVAQIGVNHKTICLGTYENLDDAINARKEAEEKYYGEYAFNSRCMVE